MLKLIRHDYVSIKLFIYPVVEVHRKVIDSVGQLSLVFLDLAEDGREVVLGEGVAIRQRKGGKY